MKRLIVSDGSGRIIATGPHPDDVPEMRGQFGFATLRGQHGHEVELPEQVTSTQHVQELHQTHEVKVEGEQPTLIPRKAK